MAAALRQAGLPVALFRDPSAAGALLDAGPCGAFQRTRHGGIPQSVRLAAMGVFPDRSARLVYGLPPAAVGRAGALSSAGAGGEEAFPVLPVRRVRLHPAAVDLFSVDFRRFCALVGRAGSVARHGRGAVEFFRIPDHDGGALDLSHAIGHASGRFRTRERLKALYSDSARVNRGTSPGGRSR